jgi:hypothetical protein
MSRHRKAYDEDDLYDDYYDDDENYDDMYYDVDNNEQNSKQYSVQQFSKTDCVKQSKRNDNIDYALFVMEALGEVQITKDGRFTDKGVSEKRIQQMLELFDFDVQRTIDHFSSVSTKVDKANKKSSSQKVSLKPPTLKPVAIPTGNASTGILTANGKSSVKAIDKSNVELVVEDVASVEQVKHSP